jgi:uncharacterized membrane protein
VQFLEWIRSADPWRVIPVVALGWLAYFFGRTLRAGRVPLIERIARIGIPELPLALCRYTRRLTTLWCMYFVVAGLLSLFGPLPHGLTGLVVALGALVLFVGEHRLRSILFPGQDFPSLGQQIRHTMIVWRRGP